MMNTGTKTNRGRPTDLPPGSRLRTLTNTFGVIAVLLSLWAAALIAMLAGPQFVVMTHVDGYKPAEFTVERVIYQSGERRGSSSSRPTRAWAEGTVNGTKERFRLGAAPGGYLPKFPSSQKELEGMIEIGRVLQVLYNPEVPDTLDVRTLYPSKDFPTNVLVRRTNMYKYGFGPMAIALGLCLLCSIADRSLTGLKYAVGCVPFPLMGLLFAWLDLSA